jgi:hypothetical protein
MSENIHFDFSNCIFYLCVNFSFFFVFSSPTLRDSKILFGNLQLMAVYGCDIQSKSKTREIFAHYCQYFAWPRYLPSALPAVPIFNILISPKYEPALSTAITIFPLSPTTCSRPRFTMYISFPTSPEMRRPREKISLADFHRLIEIKYVPFRQM